MRYTAISQNIVTLNNSDPNVTPMNRGSTLHVFYLHVESMYSVVSLTSAIEHSLHQMRYMIVVWQRASVYYEKHSAKPSADSARNMVD